MTKASAALLPLKGISFTWALGHAPHSSFTTRAEAEDAILEIIARATETVRIGYKVEWQDGETPQAYFDTRPDMVKARHRERRRYVVGPRSSRAWCLRATNQHSCSTVETIKNTRRARS